MAGPRGWAEIWGGHPKGRKLWAVHGRNSRSKAWRWSGSWQPSQWRCCPPPAALAPAKGTVTQLPTAQGQQGLPTHARMGQLLFPPLVTQAQAFVIFGSKKKCDSNLCMPPPQSLSHKCTHCPPILRWGECRRSLRPNGRLLHSFNRCWLSAYYVLGSAGCWHP